MQIKINSSRSALLLMVFAAAMISSFSGCRKDGDAEESSGFQRAIGLTAGLYPSLPVNGNETGVTGDLGLEAGVPTVKGFYFESKGPGTLVLIKQTATWGTCSRNKVKIDVTFKTWGQDGNLQQIFLLEPHKPIHMGQAVRGLVEVLALSPTPCDGFQVTLLAKFLEINIPTGTSSSNGEPDPIFGGNTNPTPIHENPPVIPGTNPPLQTTCDPVREPLPATASPAVASRIEFYGLRSKGEGCSKTLVWKTFENLRPTPVEECRLHPTQAIVESDPGGAQLVKLQETTAELARQLVWINGSNTATANAIGTTFNQGKVVKLTRDDACLAAAGVGTILLDHDADVLFFAGDPRSGPFDSMGVPLSLTINPAGASSGLKVEYRYDGSGAAHFFLRVNWAFKGIGSVPDPESKGVKVNFFHRRTRSFVSDWISVADASLFTGTVTIADPAVLRRLMPRMGEVEMVLVRERSTGGVIGAFPFFSYFNDPTQGNLFTDLSRPGRNRFLLKEEDLPAN